MSTSIKPNAFIGSSREAIDVATAIHSQISHVVHYVKLFVIQLFHQETSKLQVVLFGKQ